MSGEKKEFTPGFPSNRSVTCNSPKPPEEATVELEQNPGADSHFLNLNSSHLFFNPFVLAQKCSDRNGLIICLFLVMQSIYVLHCFFQGQAVHYQWPTVFKTTGVLWKSRLH